MSIKFPLVTGAQAREMRDKLRMNQTELWGAVFITQSGASRDESGRAIPKPAQILIALKYGKGKMKAQAAKALGIE